MSKEEIIKWVETIKHNIEHINVELNTLMLTTRKTSMTLRVVVMI